MIEGRDSAFPRAFAIPEDCCGMTLRDYFAAAALQGLLSNMEFDAIDTLHTAQTAYAFAGEMIKERAK